MTILIDRVQAATPELAEFLAAHLRDLEPTAPPESRHALGLDRLLRPGVRLFAARVDDTLAGTAALAGLEPAHEELKSMRTAPSLRGRGVGSALLDALVADARARGIRRISLETGTADHFWAAHRLYAKAGFDECEPFGSYIEDPHSLFLSLRLDQFRPTAPSGPRQGVVDSPDGTIPATW
ncbi:GNAT family N-acetyltransferase [Microbacterium sp. 22242]|uniref:GNAT family N-acetyltransferase n=1 Tax=Microbacterium sp. 22242 TaxID=3453896 RepID=UPI003F82D097